MHSVFLLHALGVGRFGVSVVCVDGKEIQELNRAYRNEDSSTDVLSFPYHEVGAPGTMLNTTKHNCSSYLRTWFQVSCRHRNETATTTLGISYWGHPSLRIQDGVIRYCCARTFFFVQAGLGRSVLGHTDWHALLLSADGSSCHMGF